MMTETETTCGCGNFVDDEEVRLPEGDFRSQGDLLLHWLQGSQDVARIAAVPAPAPQPTPPPPSPSSGQARTTSDLNLRTGPGPGYRVRATMPAGSVVTLEGSTRGDWRKICYRCTSGWCHAGYLAFDADQEEITGDFPPFRWRYRWWFGGTSVGAAAEVMAAIDAILHDPRGWQRAGISIERVADKADANVHISVVDQPCGGAYPACCKTRTGQPAVIELGANDWGRPLFTRRVAHEFGHAAFRAYDLYEGNPGQFDDDKWFSIMGNLRDSYGDHHWPDADDIKSAILWCEGTAPNVVPR